MSFPDLGLSGLYSATDDSLNNFYIRTLKEAVSYDRVSGYFRSTALSAAAPGLTHFIRANARMRLICGAELTEEDLRALTEGEPLSDVLARRLLDNPLNAVDIISDHRLEVLAYMMREGLLQIKIGVPTSPAGKPIRRSETDRYFHSKFGVLTDAVGNRVAFIGSDNESRAGWQNNHETFTVAKSWLPEVWAEQGAEICRRFERLWTGSAGEGWAIVTLPEAVQDHLIGFAKPDPPRRKDPAEDVVHETHQLELARLSFLRAAPRLRGGTGVGFATAGIEPWPHQLAIARQAVDTFPRSYLLADEVGLGKTIEAGLIIRELLVSERARRILLLVPASVMKQWQEELFEKFALDVPRFDGSTFWGADGTERPVGGNPWRAFPAFIASSHLARRHSRRDELLAAGPWDVVLVDEAHHARRRGSKANATPNTLLALLLAMKTESSWQALYLASATPMQMHPHEAWDLLFLLGLRGRWADGADAFVRYYTELREPFVGRDWAFLARMSRDFFAEPGRVVDSQLEAAIKHDLGLAGSNPVREFANNGLTDAAADAMPSATRAWMDRWLRANTPMRERVFRTTRHMLRQYKAQGILPPETVIPTRSVRDRFIPMTSAETELYARIERYIHRWYDAYRGSANQKPLGFIMTVYRRRLTSSFEAIERSLERRLTVLREKGTVAGLLDEDDLTATESDAPEDLALELQATALAREIEELEKFLEALRQRPPDESKMAYLHDELKTTFDDFHNTALIFTQYTDTMDYVRDQLVPVYGSRVACYSGRGGERWDAATKSWTHVPKADLKNLFRAGEEVKILIGTDSLSEGLNLQTCAKLINYDMPWNFMRVEQRIGRVDRIGGKEVVHVSNYFYRDTVEEQVYEGIGEDFDWFEDVVGPAQPVLDQVERAIEHLAMEAPGAARQRDLKKRVGDIRQSISEAQKEPIQLGDLEGAPPARHEGYQPILDLPDLEEVITRSTATADHLTRDAQIAGVYDMRIRGSVRRVTMRRAVLAEHSPDVQLLTYQTDAFAELMAEARVPRVELEGGRFMYEGRDISRLADFDVAPPPAPARERSLTVTEQTGEIPFGDRL